MPTFLTVLSLPHLKGAYLHIFYKKKKCVPPDGYFMSFTTIHHLQYQNKNKITAKNGKRKMFYCQLNIEKDLKSNNNH